MRTKGNKWATNDEGDAKMISASYRTRTEAIEAAMAGLKTIGSGLQLPGFTNPSLFGALFRESSQPWGAIARAHIKSVWDTVASFFRLALEYLTSNATAERLQKFWLDPIMKEMLQAAEDILEEILESDQNHVAVFNHFAANTEKSQLRRSRTQEVMEYLDKELKASPAVWTRTRVERIISSLRENEVEDLDAENALNDVNAYYEVCNFYSRHLHLEVSS